MGYWKIDKQHELICNYFSLKPIFWMIKLRIKTTQPSLSMVYAAKWWLTRVVSASSGCPKIFSRFSRRNEQNSPSRRQFFDLQFIDHGLTLWPFFHKKRTNETFHGTQCSPDRPRFSSSIWHEPKDPLLQRITHPDEWVGFISLLPKKLTNKKHQNLNFSRVNTPTWVIYLHKYYERIRVHLFL